MAETAAATPGAGESAPVSADAPVSGAKEVGLFDLQGAEFAAVMGMPHADAAKVKLTDARTGGRPAPKPDAEGEGDGESFEYEFAGKTYTGKTEKEARYKAEQAYRTFKSHRDQARNENRQLQAEIAALKARPGQSSSKPASTPAATKPQPSPNPPGQVDSDLSLTDTDFQWHAGLVKQGRHAEAAMYLQIRNEEVLKNQLDQARRELRDEFSESLKQIKEPQDEANRQAAIEKQASETLRTAMEAEDEMGEPLFPELRDKDNLDSFVQHWAALINGDEVNPGMPLEFAHTYAGQHMAYCAWVVNRALAGEPISGSRIFAALGIKGKKAGSPAPAAPRLTVPPRLASAVDLRPAPARPATPEQARPKHPVEAAFSKEANSNDWM